MTEKKQFVCPVCGAKRNTMQKMQDHFDKKHPDKK